MTITNLYLDGKPFVAWQQQAGVDRSEFGGVVVIKLGYGSATRYIHPDLFEAQGNAIIKIAELQATAAIPVIGVDEAMSFFSMICATLGRDSYQFDTTGINTGVALQQLFNSALALGLTLDETPEDQIIGLLDTLEAHAPLVVLNEEGLPCPVVSITGRLSLQHQLGEVVTEDHSGLAITVDEVSVDQYFAAVDTQQETLRVDNRIPAGTPGG